MKYKVFQINPETDRKLTELSKKRKGEQAMIKSKKDIVANFMDKAYKREIKQ